MEKQEFRRDDKLLRLWLVAAMAFGLLFLFGARQDRDGHPYPLWFFCLPLIGATIEVAIRARLRLEVGTEGVRWRTFWGGFRSARWEEIEAVRDVSGPNSPTERLRFLAPHGEVGVTNRAARAVLEARLEDKPRPLAVEFRSGGWPTMLGFLLLTWATFALTLFNGAHFFPVQEAVDPLFLGIGAGLAIPLLAVTAFVIHHTLAARDGGRLAFVRRNRAHLARRPRAGLGAARHTRRRTPKRDAARREFAFGGERAKLVFPDGAGWLLEIAARVGGAAPGFGVAAPLRR